jgi:hypothetical protein
MERLESSMNSTRTWVTPPREPVRPRTFVTLASLTGVLESCNYNDFFLAIALIFIIFKFVELKVGLDVGN